MRSALAETIIGIATTIALIWLWTALWPRLPIIIPGTAGIVVLALAVGWIVDRRSRA